MRTRGYMSAEYGESFAEFGEIVTLPRSGMRLIKRHIEGRLFDCIGLYLFKNRWANAHRRSLFGVLVLDRSAKSELVNRTDSQDTEFFPAYRRSGTSFYWRPDLTISNKGREAGLDP